MASMPAAARGVVPRMAQLAIAQNAHAASAALIVFIRSTRPAPMLLPTYPDRRSGVRDGWNARNWCARPRERQHSCRALYVVELGADKIPALRYFLSMARTPPGVAAARPRRRCSRLYPGAVLEI